MKNLHLNTTCIHEETFDQGFDGFPMFSADGGELVFASNRNQSRPGETDIFVPDWLE